MNKAIICTYIDVTPITLYLHQWKKINKIKLTQFLINQNVGSVCKKGCICAHIPFARYGSYVFFYFGVKFFESSARYIILVYGQQLRIYHIILKIKFLLPYYDEEHRLSSRIQVIEFVDWRSVLIFNNC